MSYWSVLNVSNGGPSNPKLTLKINSLRIKRKAQNFASWMLSEYAFKIERKQGNDFLIIAPLAYMLRGFFRMSRGDSRGVDGVRNSLNLLSLWPQLHFYITVQVVFHCFFYESSTFFYSKLKIERFSTTQLKTSRIHLDRAPFQEFKVSPPPPLPCACNDFVQVYRDRKVKKR